LPILSVVTVLLLGASGQLGSDLLKLAGDRPVSGFGHAELDIRDRGLLASRLTEIRPEVIVNAAAYVDVEGCESDRELAFAVNADAVRGLAEEADRAGALLVQISTDYVFSGSASSPYAEDAPTGPINVYGASKLAGEEHVLSLARRHLVVRSSGLYGATATRAKGNFVRTMLRLGRERGEVSVVTDQVLTPTNTADLAAVLWRMIDAGAQGLYHATSAGSCSWFEFAQAIFELSGMDVRMKPIDSAKLGYRARRPAYSVLDGGRLERDGFGPLRHWREALAAHLEVLAPLT
jgi:dTDP-4-dehydrorhamnose reductase